MWVLRHAWLHLRQSHSVCVLHLLWNSVEWNVPFVVASRRKYLRLATYSKGFFSQGKVAAAAGTTLARTTAIATAVGPSAVHPTTSSDRPGPMEASFPFSLSQNSIMLFRSEHLQFITSSRFPFAGVICHSAVRLLFSHCSLPFSSIASCPFLPLLPALFFHCSLPFSSIAPCPFLPLLPALFFHCSLPFSSIAPCPFLPLLPALFFHCSLPFSSIAPCPFLPLLPALFFHCSLPFSSIAPCPFLPLLPALFFHCSLPFSSIAPCPFLPLLPALFFHCSLPFSSIAPCPFLPLLPALFFHCSLPFSSIAPCPFLPLLPALFFHCSLPFSSIAPCPFLPLLPALFFHCSLPFSSIAPCPFLDFLVFCNLLVSLSHLSDNLSMWRSYAMFVLWSNQTFCFNVYFLWWGIILLHMSGVRLRCHVALTFVLQGATGAVVAAMASNLSPMSFPGTFAS